MAHINDLVVNPDGLLRAAYIRLGHDAGGGDISIVLYNEQSEPFAVATMSRQDFAKFVGSCADLLQALAHGGLAAMPAGGRA